MKIEVDINKLEDICEMATNDCEVLYKFVFGNECKRKKMLGGVSFFKRRQYYRMVKEGREKI